MSRINKRQQALLACIKFKDSQINIENLNNAMHIACQDKGLDEFYYKFNLLNETPVSFQLQNDLKLLEKNSLIQMNSGNVKLTKEAESNFGHLVTESISFTKSMFNPRLRVKTGVNKSKFGKLQKIFFTMGYEGFSIDETVAILLEADVEYLVDVRKNPVSRVFGYSKNRLSDILSKYRVEYIHIPELGIDSILRKNLQSVEDYKRLFRHYRNNVLPKAKLFTQFSIELVTNHTTCFMCYEAMPEYCHRDSLAKYISANSSLDKYDLREL